jgi:hypothetical protein
MDRRDAASQDPERRHFRRAAHAAPALIVMGPETYVFCDIENLSPAGACLTTPRAFHLEVGEAVMLESRDLCAPCAARVVAVEGRRFRCAFDHVAVMEVAAAAA